MSRPVCGFSTQDGKVPAEGNESEFEPHFRQGLEQDTGDLGRSILVQDKGPTAK